jgi:hypothetical protein
LTEFHYEQELRRWAGNFLLLSAQKECKLRLALYRYLQLSHALAHLHDRHTMAYSVQNLNAELEVIP